jgi:tripartite-type tricarboxylate transporter receptor subunit TctC
MNTLSGTRPAVPLTSSLPSLSRRHLLALGLGGAATWLHAPAMAQAWPSKPVKITTAASAGSGPDVSLRVLAEQLARRWGQPVVVDNKPGGNGIVAFNATRAAAADGHELIHLDSTMLTSNVHLYSRLPYEPQRDFEPIRPTLQTDFFVAVGKDSPFKSIDDIVQAAQAAPDKVTYGSWGPGSPGHLGALRLLAATNVRMTHVPYKEIPQLFAAVATGEVQWALGSLASAGPMEKTGRLRFIGVAAPQPSPFAPGVPGMAGSAQAKAFVSNAWFGLFAPKGTPKPLREKVAADIAEALAAPDLVERYRTLGYNRFDMKPDEFAEYIGRETQLWGRVIEGAKLKLE